MFIPDFHFDAPGSGEILAELGVDRHTVSEVIEHDRAIRCPDRDSVYRDRPRAMFDIDTPFARALHEAAFPDLLDPSPALPPAH